MIKDNIKREELNDIKFPEIHGHVCIKTYYAKSGNLDKVIEGDNVVTNAVRDIFANNVVGGIDYSKLLPLFQTWFGGILCYANPHAVDSQTSLPDPDDYFPQDDGHNLLIAHAGNTAPSDMADDRRRGAPNSSSYSYSSNTVTLGWEWGSTQGNCPVGTSIRSLSLTHADTGNAGLGSTSTAFANFHPLAKIQGSHLSNVNPALFIDDIVAKYDDENGLAFYIGDQGDYGSGSGSARYRFETNQITVCVRPFAFKKVGLFNTTSAVTSITDAQSTTQIERVFTVTIPFNCYCQPAYHFDYATKHLWIFNNITGTDMAYSQTINYCEIDCTPSAATRIVSNGSFTTTGTALLAPTVLESIGVIYWVGTQPNIIKDGNLVYVPTTASSNFTWEGGAVNGFRVIDLSNTANQSNVSFNTAQSKLRSIMKGGDLLVYGGRVINNGVGYTCQDDIYPDPINYGFGITQPMSASSYVTSIAPSATSATLPRYIVANKMLNTTLFNLPTPAEKTSVKSMTITYSLTYSS